MTTDSVSAWSETASENEDIAGITLLGSVMVAGDVDNALRTIMAQIAAAKLTSTSVGTIVDYAGSTSPDKWLLCYGQAVSRTTYADLYTAIGTTYGTGDGSTTFNVPDLRGRVTAGQDDMGGTSANRLTNQAGGLNGDTLGATGGSETHTLTTAQMPSHTHTLTDPGHAHNSSDGTGLLTSSGTGGLVSTTQTNGVGRTVTTSTASATTGISLASTGSGNAHNNIQPTIILNKIIYAGA